MLILNGVVSPVHCQVRKYKGMILEDLENALAEHAPPGGGDLSSDLPPLTIDGIPVSVDKMTQVGLSQEMALQDRGDGTFLTVLCQNTHTHFPLFQFAQAQGLNSHSCNVMEDK